MEAVYAECKRGGVWTTVSLFVDEKEWVDAAVSPKCNGNHSARDYFGERRPYPEMQVSAKDSEVATLAALSEYFYENPNRFVGVKKVQILLSGNIGPCDGCKQRIKDFIADIEIKAHSEKWNFELIMIVNYFTKTSQTSRGSLVTTYGYESDSEVNDFQPAFAYYTRQYIVTVGTPLSKPIFAPQSSSSANRGDLPPASASSTVQSMADASSYSSPVQQGHVEDPYAPYPLHHGYYWSPDLSMWYDDIKWRSRYEGVPPETYDWLVRQWV